MKIYNTLSRQVEDFRSISVDVVKLYTCGPTVYDYAHIGNLRSFVFYDTLRRTLEFAGYSVKQVMNITDVGHLSSDADAGDDKLEKGARRENKSVWEVADYYIKAFIADSKSLNIRPPNGYAGKHAPYPRATDFIDDQINIIKLLLQKNYAYVSEQAVYFDVSQLDDYGLLTGQKLSDKEQAARQEVVIDNNKRQPQDFALWFFKTGRFANHSMAWPSPWGDGFPGWHLECSAIIHATLGEPLDIHTGGVDHIGTHHTNEIAQTEAAFGKQLAKYWMHNEHLLAQGQKMSKSTGNFITLADISNQGGDALALRLLFLQSHYRSQTNFTWESLSAAQSFLADLRSWSDLRWQDVLSVIDHISADQLITQVQESMESDLNSPQALADINDFVDKKTPSAELLAQLDSFFGLGLADRPDIEYSDKQLIKQREAARQSHDWLKADELRARLLDKRIELSDTPSGARWTRI